MCADNYSVYIVKNDDAKFYIGLTDDVARRVSQHNQGISTWTRGKGPWRLVWEKGELSLSQARKLELELKRQKGGGGFYRMTGLKHESDS